MTGVNLQGPTLQFSESAKRQTRELKNDLEKYKTFIVHWKEQQAKAGDAIKEAQSSITWTLLSNPHNRISIAPLPD